MARPIKEGMDYFPHDTDARTDLKIRKLRAMFGNNGYATYFILLENIYRQKQYQLEVLDDETNLILAEECKVNIEEFNKILSKCLDLGLFDEKLFEESKILTSNAIKRRAEPIESTRTRKRTWKNNKNSGVLDGENKVLDGENAQSKEKKSKEKKNKAKETTTTISSKEDECSVDSDFNILRYAEQRNFILSAIQIEQIQEDIEIYSLEEVKRALDISDNNGKHTYSYMKGILDKRRAGANEKNKNQSEFEKLVQKSNDTGEDPF